MSDNTERINSAASPAMARAIRHEKANYECAVAIVSDVERYGGAASGLCQWAAQYLRRRRGSPAVDASPGVVRASKGEQS